MRLSEYISKLDEKISKKLSSLEKNLNSEIEGFGTKMEEKINNIDDYLGEKTDYAKKEWNKLKPEVRADIKKGAIGAWVALVTPWYIALPAGVYAYTKAKKFLKLRKSYPKKEE